MKISVGAAFKVSSVWGPWKRSCSISTSTRSSAFVQPAIPFSHHGISCAPKRRSQNERGCFRLADIFRVSHTISYMQQFRIPPKRNKNVRRTATHSVLLRPQLEPVPRQTIEIVCTTTLSGFVLAASACNFLYYLKERMPSCSPNKFSFHFCETVFNFAKNRPSWSGFFFKNEGGYANTKDASLRETWCPHFHSAKWLSFLVNSPFTLLLSSCFINAAPFPAHFAFAWLLLDLLPISVPSALQKV